MIQFGAGDHRTFSRFAMLGFVLLLTGCPSRSPADPHPTTQSARATTAPDMTVELNGLKAKWVKALGNEYHGAAHSPFLVVMDSGEAVAQRWLVDTVQAAATRITAQYLDARPDKPIVILLFSGQEHYRKACKEQLNMTEPPYFGFCRPEGGGSLMVMDIKTGGGTLIHELTHALIAFDFPNIPDWFNEGMGSLYEQSGYEPGRLVGLVNWRLTGLQTALREKRLGSLEELTQGDFRGAKMGLNYAQARYLCLYMQNKGLLSGFYRAFRDGYEEDKTGLKFLKAAFAPQSLADVDAEWRKWVMTLRWPPE